MGSDVDCTYRIRPPRPLPPPPAEPFPSQPRGGEARPGSGAVDGDVDTLERAREPPCLCLRASPRRYRRRRLLKPGTTAQTPATAQGSRPSRPELVQAGAWQPSGTKIALAKASSVTRSRAGASTESPVRRGGWLCALLSSLSRLGDFLLLPRLTFVPRQGQAGKSRGSCPG